MKKIFKYRLPSNGGIVTITANVIKWLDIQEQDGWPTIWAMVDDEGHESEYEIAAWGTGWDFPDAFNHYKYMGTAQDGYGYVWHYFMQEKAKSWSPADSGIAIEPLDYLNEWLSTTPATINCDDAKSAISGLICKDGVSTTTLRDVIESLTQAAIDSNTAAILAST